MRYFFIAIITTISFVSCDTRQGVYVNRQDISEAALSPGFHTQSAGLTNGDELLYGTWIPVIANNRKVPLVIALHYAGPETPYRGYGYMQVLVQPALFSLGAIIIAPDAPADSWVDKKSEEVVMSLISAAIEEWPVNPDSIIVTGYSLGGIGTWYLADKYPDEFALAIPMASDPVGFVTGKVPHYVIQGSRDELFGTSDVRRAVEIIKKNGKKAELVIADDLGHYEPGGYIPFLQQSVLWISEVNKK